MTKAAMVTTATAASDIDPFSLSSLRKDTLIEIALRDDAIPLLDGDDQDETLYWYRAQFHQRKKDTFTVKHMDGKARLVHRALPNTSTLWRPVKPLHTGTDIAIYTRNDDRDPLTWFPARLLKWRGADTYNIRYNGDPEDSAPNEFDGQIDPWRQRASLSIGDYVLLPYSASVPTTSSKSKKRKAEEQEKWVAGRVVKRDTPTHVTVRLDQSSRDVYVDTRVDAWRLNHKKTSSRKKRRRRY
jgi:hypothetical protein